MKLGEILTQMRIIDEGDLKEALDAQLIYGGHLGTCLIEQGCITEDQLGQVLAKTFGVRCAMTMMFANIPKYVIESLPRAMVEKHHAVPFRIEDKKLDIAMLHPTDLQAVDELSFACGRKVTPWIAPEVRLLQAMDRYYDIARRMRYITLARQLDDAAPQSVYPAGAPEPQTTRPSPAPSQSAIADTAVAIRDRAKAAAAAANAGTRIDPLEPLAKMLCRVAGEAMLGQIVLEHAVPDGTRSILFNVQSGSAVPWDWRGVDLDRDAAAKLRFPISGEPLFSLLLGEGSYRGPVPSDARYHGFYETLGMDPPNEMILVPSYADDRLVALLYFDTGDGMGIHEDTSTFCRIARKVGLALNLIQIKQQIRTV